MTWGVIDLGTNTFHLLLAERSSDSFRIVFRKRFPVRLGRNGLSTFSKEVLRDAQEAILNLHTILKEYKSPVKLRIIGTSAMRTASNRDELIAFIHNLFGVKVEIIDGHQEAKLIHKGVAHFYPPQQASLLMDIGGGSIEFVLFDQDGIHYLESLPLGIGVLYHQFQLSNPATSDELKDAQLWILNHLKPLIREAKKVKASHFIGSSGTFDLLYDLFPLMNSPHGIDQKACLNHLRSFIKSSMEERRNFDSFPSDRLDYIPVAYLLVLTVLEAFRPETLSLSPYALKEGVLCEMMGFS